MKKYLAGSIIILLFITVAIVASDKNKKKESDMAEKNKTEKIHKQLIADNDGKVKMSDDEWKKVLSDEEYRVIRECGTEPPFSGKYYHFDGKGTFVCAACGNELFSSDTKYDSGSGWPAFWNAIDSTKVKTKTDTAFGMTRVEITCARCGAHLGHVFDDGPQPTGLRYCVNSISLDFKPDSSTTTTDTNTVDETE